MTSILSDIYYTLNSVCCHYFHLHHTVDTDSLELWLAYFLVVL